MQPLTIAIVFAKDRNVSLVSSYDGTFAESAFGPDIDWNKFCIMQNLEAKSRSRTVMSGGKHSHGTLCFTSTIHTSYRINLKNVSSNFV